jgi:hypothetical protein
MAPEFYPDVQNRSSMISVEKLDRPRIDATAALC